MANVEYVKAFPTGRIWVTEAAAWAQFAKPTWPFNLVRQAAHEELQSRRQIGAGQHRVGPFAGHPIPPRAS